MQIVLPLEEETQSASSASDPNRMTLWRVALPGLSATGIWTSRPGADDYQYSSKCTWPMVLR